VSALAKGVAKPTSRLALGLIAFVPSRVTLHRRSGELYLVTGSLAQSAPPQYTLAQSAATYTVAEYLLALLPVEKPLLPEYALFEQFLAALTGSAQPELLSLAMRAQLLLEFGYLVLPTGDTRPAKFLRFLVASELAALPRVAATAADLATASQTLAAVYTEATGKPPRVPEYITEFHA
jgi:recombinational DNA repair protein (RecF pathway)